MGSVSGPSLKHAATGKRLRRADTGSSLVAVGRRVSSDLAVIAMKVVHLGKSGQAVGLRRSQT